MNRKHIEKALKEKGFNIRPCEERFLYIITEKCEVYIQASKSKKGQIRIKIQGILNETNFFEGEEDAISFMDSIFARRGHEKVSPLNIPTFLKGRK